MKKITILVLSLLTLTGLVGCEKVIDETNLDTHLTTMDSLDTYVIQIESNRETTTNTEVAFRSIYVDNINSTFLVSDHVKTPIGVENCDVVYKVIDNDIFGYIYNNGWTEYQIDHEYTNLKYLEVILFDFFENATITVNDELQTYESTTTLSMLEGNTFNMFDRVFTDEDRVIEFPITAVYSSEENRFLSFELDLSPIINKTDSNFPETTEWKVTQTFENFDADFELNIDVDFQDDHVGDFNLNNAFQIVNKFCYEMIKGSLDFAVDKDLFKIEFAKAGVFQIKATELDNIDNLYISVLDEYENVIRSFKLDADDSTSNYWPYAKGTYYVQVSGDTGILDTSEYSFLFLSN